MASKYYTIVGTTISILLSVAAIVISFFDIQKCEESEMSYVGLIVSLLAILFTIFVGYQIYNAIDVREELKKIDKMLVKIDRLKELQYRNEFYYIHNKGLIAITLKKWKDSINMQLSALSILLNSSLKDEHVKDFNDLANNLDYCYGEISNWHLANDSIKNNEIMNKILEIQNNPNLSLELKNVIQKIKIKLESK